MPNQIAGQLASGTQTRVFFLAAVLGSGSIFSIAVISWLAGADKHNLPPPDKRLHFLVRLYCALDLAVLVAWATLLTRSSWVSDIPLGYLRLLPLLSVIGAAGVCVSSYNCHRTWLNPNRNIAAKLEELSVVMAFLAFDFVVGAILR
jgi:hypothetical protein